MSEGREPAASPQRGREETDVADPANGSSDPDAGAAPETGRSATAEAGPSERRERSAGAATRADTDAAARPSAGSPPPPGHTAAPPRAGRRGGFTAFLAFLALLIACAALAAIGWPLWMLYQGQDPLAMIPSDRLAAYETRIAALENVRTGAERAERAAQAAEEDASAAARRASEAEAAVATLREAFVDLSARTTEAAPPDDRQWRLAEAAYLLRVANLRARMENDRDGARALLEAADAVIADLDDYGLFPVREEIARALTALRGQPVADRVGLYLELEQLGDRVAELPLDLPEYRPRAPEVAEDARWYETLGARAAGLFEFRANRSEPVRPLLPPDEAVWLRHNLQLHLEQAQLALLRGHAAVWTDTLEEARRWVQDHFDADDPEAVALTEALTRLIDERIDVPAPDISGPLAALQQLRGRGLPETAP